MQRAKETTSIELIGETGFTHKGESDYVLRQIELISNAEFDYVKFQMLLDVDAVYSATAPAYDDLKRHRFSGEDWGTILRTASDMGLKVIVMPIDYQAILFAEAHHELISTIEVHSIALNDVRFLKQLSGSLAGLQQRIPVMLGIGGRSVSEIAYAKNTLDSETQSLMYGFQSFPTTKQQANLGKIRSLIREFDLPVGYADHTPWNENDSDMVQIALALGATHVEKHIILEEGDHTRPDYYSAVGEQGALRLRSAVSRFIDYYGTDDPQWLSLSEERYRNRERKIVAAEVIEAGERITPQMLDYKVVSAVTNLPQRLLDEIVGKETIRRIDKHQALTLEDVK